MGLEALSRQLVRGEEKKAVEKILKGKTSLGKFKSFIVNKQANYSLVDFNFLLMTVWKLDLLMYPREPFVFMVMKLMRAQKTFIPAKLFTSRMENGLMNHFISSGSR